MELRRHRAYRQAPRTREAPASLLRDEIQEYYANFRVTRDLLELRNLVDVATLIVKSAHSRRESRGLHYSRDWPNSLPKALPSVLTPRARR